VSCTFLQPALIGMSVDTTLFMEMMLSHGILALLVYVVCFLLG